MRFLKITQKNLKTNTNKGGVSAWPDAPKQGATLGNLTPADRHGSVQVSHKEQNHSTDFYFICKIINIFFLILLFLFL